MPVLGPDGHLQGPPLHRQHLPAEERAAENIGAGRTFNPQHPHLLQQTAAERQRLLDRQEAGAYTRGRSRAHTRGGGVFVFLARK